MFLCCSAPAICLLKRVPQDPNALTVGIQSPAPGASNFTSVDDCARACDYDSRCAAFIVRERVIKIQTAQTCILVKGNEQPGKFLRTVVRTDADNVGIKATFLCPSGYQVVPDSQQCMPITTPQQVCKCACVCVHACACMYVAVQQVACCQTYICHFAFVQPAPHIAVRRLRLPLRPLVKPATQRPLLCSRTPSTATSPIQACHLECESTLAISFSGCAVRGRPRPRLTRRRNG